MTVSEAPSAGDQRHGRDTQEFTRLVNLSDAVFAIAMTLLVLTVNVPDVPGPELAAALLADVPQIGAYALAFALVASQWYAHRKLFQRLAFTEPGLTVINLAWLGIVALVPFPTSVLGAHPTVTAAIAPFLSLFVVLGLGYIALIARAQAIGAWTAHTSADGWAPIRGSRSRRPGVRRGFVSGARTRTRHRSRDLRCGRRC